jgi:EamA domain-containing membrane protein RarD
VLVFEPWLRRHGAELPPLVRALFGTMTTRQFAAGVAVLALGYVAASAAGVRMLRSGRAPWPYLIVTGAFAGNAITHVLQSVLFRGYTPGVVTALLVSLQYGWLAARSRLAEQIVSRRALGWCVTAGVVGQIPLALLALRAGQRLGMG